MNWKYVLLQIQILIVLGCVLSRHLQEDFDDLTTKASDKDNYINKFRGGNLKAIRHSTTYCDCQQLATTIISKHSHCSKLSSTVVDICLEFNSDYEYLWSFLLHYLLLGASRIHLYNNSPNIYKLNQDPGIICLVETGFLVIVPWLGDGVQNVVQNNCFKTIELYYTTGAFSLSLNNIWGANIDVDELLVLHKQDCINKFVDSYSNAPGVILNWALYPPASNNTFIPVLSDKYTKSNPFPYELLQYRAKQSVHSKSIVRIACFHSWSNPHFANYKNCSNYSPNSVDVLNRTVILGRRPPYRLPCYEVAHLNHYWTYSLKHFLRKMHRGESFYENKVFRTSQEYFDMRSKHANNLVYDDSFIRKYSMAIKSMDALCPHNYFWSTQLDPKEIDVNNVYMERLNNFKRSQNTI